MNILIADDAAFMRDMLREIFEGEGMKIVGEAEDGVEAVAEFNRLHPDVCIMDIVMPRQHGIDAVKEIRKKHPSAIIVMASALGQESLVMEALSAGACEFIIKPFKPDSVITTIRHVTEKN